MFFFTNLKFGIFCLYATAKVQCLNMQYPVHVVISNSSLAQDNFQHCDWSNSKRHIYHTVLVHASVYYVKHNGPYY